MKTNELMIGDYVRYIGTEAICDMRKGDIVRVDALQGKYICVGNGWVHGDMIEPIPLTAEILEKNGFKKINNDKFPREQYSIENFFGDGGIIIRLTELTCGEWELYVMSYDISDTRTSFSKELSFLRVHELQHALRLCGIDKNIEP